MKQIRYGTFETNSSSTHALVLFNDEDYQKFKNGEIVLDDNLKPIPLGNLELEERSEDDWCPYGAMVDKNDREFHYFTASSLDEIDKETEKIKTPKGDIVHGISIYISDC